MKLGISLAEVKLMEEFLKHHIQSEENADIKAGYIQGLNDLGELISGRISENLECFTFGVDDETKTI